MSYRTRLVPLRLRVLKRYPPRCMEPIPVVSVSLSFKIIPVYLKINIILRTAVPILSNVKFSVYVCNL
jgi:hypothetical protein